MRDARFFIDFYIQFFNQHWREKRFFSCSPTCLPTLQTFREGVAKKKFFFHRDNDRRKAITCCFFFFNAMLFNLWKIYTKSEAYGNGRFVVYMMESALIKGRDQQQLTFFPLLFLQILFFTISFAGWLWTRNGTKRSLNFKLSDFPSVLRRRLPLLEERFF